MKMFAIQAMCPEKHLWDVMRRLEQAGCIGMQSRPLLNGHDDSPNGKHEPGTTIRDLVLKLFRESKGSVTSKDVKIAMRAAGFVTQPYGVLFNLKKEKLIRRVSAGTYALTTRGEAT
jgi:hypothetical protein